MATCKFRSSKGFARLEKLQRILLLKYKYTTGIYFVVNPNTQSFMKHVPSISVLVLSTLLAAPLVSQGSLLVYDDFSYNVANGTSVVDLNGGTGWGGAWTSNVSAASVVAGTIRTDRDFNGLMPMGYTLPIGSNSLNVMADTALSSTRVNRSLSTGVVNFDTAGDLYFSFAYARIDTTNNAGTEACSFTFQSGGTTKLSVGFDASEYLTMTAGSSTTTSTTVNMAFTGSWNTTSKYLLVGKIETANDGTNSIYLSLFDSSDNVSSAPLTWDLVLENINITGSADALSLVIGKYAQNMILDNIAIGTTFADVTAIPEPAQAAALLGLLAIGLAVIRQRRR